VLPAAISSRLAPAASRLGFDLKPSRLAALPASASANADGPAKLTPIKRRARGEESLADIGRSYNVSGAAISRLTP
jgi:hypothetical protein